MPEDKPYIQRLFKFMDSAYGVKGSLSAGAFSKNGQPVTFDDFYGRITKNPKYADKIYEALNAAYGPSGRLRKGAFTSNPDSFKNKVLVSEPPKEGPKQFPVAEQLMDFSKLGQAQPVAPDPNTQLAQSAMNLPTTAAPIPGVMSDIGAIDPLIAEKEKQDQQLISDFNNTVFNTTPAKDVMTGRELPLTDFQLNMKEQLQRIDEFDKNLQLEQAKADEFAKTTAGGLYYSFVRPIYQTFLNVGKNVSAATARLAGDVGGSFGLEDSQRVLNKTADGLVDYFDFNRLAREGNSTGFLNLTPTAQQGKLSRANILPKAVEAISNMASLMGGTRILGGNSTALFTSSFMSTYEDYRKTAKQAGLTNNEADQFALTSAGVTSMLEMISPNRILLRPGELSSATRGVFKAIKDGVPVKQAVKEAFKQGAKEIGKENIQELSQAIGDKVIRGGTDLATGQNRFNEDGVLPSFDEALETVVLTTIATGVMSSRRVARNATPSNIERSAWAQAAERPGLIEDGIAKGLENGTVTEEQAIKIRKDVGEYRAIYDGLKTNLEETNPNADVARIALDALKSKRLSEEGKPLQGIPALSAVKEQNDVQNAELENNIKDELVGVPEIGTEVSSAEVKNIMAETGAENKINKISDNDYKVQIVDLAKLYQTNEEFKSYVDQERLRESSNEDGLRIPVIVNNDGKVVDGLNRLAQQYVNGNETARAFVETVPVVQEETPPSINVQRPEDIKRPETTTIGVERQAPSTEQAATDEFQIAPVFAGEEIVNPPSEPALSYEAAPVDEAKARRDKAVGRLKDAWSEFNERIQNSPYERKGLSAPDPFQDKKFYAALANYVKEELIYRINQVKDFAGKKKAQMKRDIIKSMRDEEISVEDFSMLNDAFEDAYAEAKNIPGLLSDNNDRVSYRQYMRDKIKSREAGRRSGEAKGKKEGRTEGEQIGKEKGERAGRRAGLSEAQQRVKEVRAAILETAKATGIKLNVMQLRRLSGLLESASKSNNIEKSIENAVNITSQMIWEAKNRQKINEVKKLISQTKKLKKSKSMTQEDVEWIKQLQFPSPAKVDDIDTYLDLLEDYVSTRKGNNLRPKYQGIREFITDFFNEENERIYREKQQLTIQEYNELRDSGVLPAEVTIEDYKALVLYNVLDNPMPKLNKAERLIEHLKQELKYLKSPDNVFIQNKSEAEKDVINNLSEVDPQILDTPDLLKLNNIINNISEYGLLDGAGQIITTYQANKQAEELEGQDIKIRKLPSARVINKKNISNIMSSLFYNDKNISQFREKVLGGIENNVSKVKAHAQRAVKEFVELNKKNKIQAQGNARLFVISYLNQFRGVESGDITKSLQQRLDEMIDDVNYLYTEGHKLSSKEGRPLIEDAQRRLDALVSFGLIVYSIEDGRLNIEVKEKFESDPEKKMESLVGDMTVGERAVYQFVLDKYAENADRLEFITRTYANKEFKRERNYVSLVPRQKDVIENPSPDLSEDTDITYSQRSINSKPSSTTISRSDRKGDKVYYDGDFFSNFVNRYYTSLYTSEVLPDLQRTAKLVNSDQFKRFITGQFDKGFNKKGTENYEKFKTKLAQVINEEKYAPFFRKGAVSVTDALISRGVKAVLGNVWQGPKQYAPAVVHNFAVNNASAVIYAMRSKGRALTDKQYAEDRQKFLGNFTGVQRSAVGSEAYDSYVKGINDDMSWWTRPVQWIDKVQKLSSFVLERADKAAQNDAYIASYITSLLRQGEIKNANEFDFAKEAENPNKEALAYAEQTASTINNESAKAYRADALTKGFYNKYLWLLQGFSLNAYQNAMSKAKIIGDNRATSAEKKEAALHFLGYLSEMGTYQLVGKWARNSQLAIAGAILSGLFGIKDDETEEEREAKKIKDNIRTGANMVADISMSGLPAPAQGVLKIAANYAYSQWAKMEAAKNKKEAKSAGGKFDPRGTHLSPYYVPFYGAEGPGGAADFYTAIFKGGIDAIVRGIEQNEKDKDDTADEKIATNLNRYLGIPAYITGAGDLVILNNRMQQIIKNAEKDKKPSKTAASSRNRRRPNTRPRRQQAR